MAKVSCHFKQMVENPITLTLSSFDHGTHGGTVKPELNRISVQVALGQGGELGEPAEEVPIEMHQVLPV